MNASTMHPAKTAAFEFVERNRQAIATLSDSVFYFAELGMQEFRTCELMTSLLEEAGFQITRNLSGFPTAFLATWGSGGPLIAMHTEFDAAPDNSQAPNCTEQVEVVPGAPGHCEGHNVNAAVLVAAAIAIKTSLEKFKIPGRLKIFGAPAEEQLLSRPYFVRDGYFKDVDVALHDHILDRSGTTYGLSSSSMISAVFNFKGETAHASLSPWKGRDALDAVVLMDMGLAQYREHFEPGMTAHRAITNGGNQPNVIPAKASVWWYFRHPSAEGARTLFEQAKRIAQGAAMMSNTEVTVDVQSSVWPTRGNQTLAETIQRNIELVGMPQWTKEEHDFARALQRQAGAKEIGLRTEVIPLTGPAKQGPTSNDSGDVSWAVPMARLYFPGNIPDVTFHHWTAGAALASTIAHKGACVGAKTMAGTAIDLFLEPSLVEAARVKFREEIGDVVYRPLLPADQQPPLELNRAAMERFRPAMEKHYVSERPRFV